MAAPKRVRGSASAMDAMAYLAIGSLLITWIFRGNKRDVLRNFADSAIVLRLLAMVALSILMFMDLVNG
ncbi:hypothetical protein [Streptomyces sp. NPDC088261]|uniref:hypothetical protein n=1 Tax=Streptomyces sp. NPDC088261 TaxID=3365851 RepID=UPI0038248FD1